MSSALAAAGHLVGAVSGTLTDGYSAAAAVARGRLIRFETPPR